MPSDLWVEKYRPHKLSEYVWRDAALKNRVQEWLKEGTLPHLLFSGTAGVGKTSLAHLLLDELEIPKGDRLFIAASRERKVDVISERISSFVNGWAIGPRQMKYVILDEADAITPLAQKVLRTEMEVYAKECRIIFTANYAERLIPAIHSRCQTFHFAALQKDEFTMRLADIMAMERIDIENEDNLVALLAITDKTYPDLRKCINLLQQGCITDDKGNKKLTAPKIEDSRVAKDYILEATNLIKAGRLKDARLLIVRSALVEEYVDIYRWLYQNLELWGVSEESQDDALIVIKKGLVNHALIADPEINLSSVLVELKMIWARTQ